MFHAAPCTTGELRLAGGNIANEGRVEVCIKNLWGTVCDDSWGSTDATVVCQQLGFSTESENSGLSRFYTTYILFWNLFVPTGAVAFSHAHFGAGQGHIHLNNVDCSGIENDLFNCSYNSFVRCNTGHLEDAGVRCQGSQFFIFHS